MPLVVPGVQSTGGDAGQEWMSKLAGKKLGEEHNETVRLSIHPFIHSFIHPYIGLPCFAPRMK